MFMVTWGTKRVNYTLWWQWHYPRAVPGAGSDVAGSLWARLRSMENGGPQHGNMIWKYKMARRRCETNKRKNKTIWRNRVPAMAPYVSKALALRGAAPPAQPPTKPPNRPARPWPSPNADLHNQNVSNDENATRILLSDNPRSHIIWPRQQLKVLHLCPYTKPHSGRPSAPRRLNWSDGTAVAHGKQAHLYLCV